jgi:hypothetical protein
VELKKNLHHAVNTHDSIPIRRFAYTIIRQQRLGDGAEMRALLVRFLF